jgi:hypothetical protein
MSNGRIIRFSCPASFSSILFLRTKYRDISAMNVYVVSPRKPVHVYRTHQLIGTCLFSSTWPEINYPNRSRFELQQLIKRLKTCIMVLLCTISAIQKTKIEEGHVWTAGCSVVDNKKSRHYMMKCAHCERDSVLLGNDLFRWNGVNIGAE